MKRNPSFKTQVSVAPTTPTTRKIGDEETNSPHSNTSPTGIHANANSRSMNQLQYPAQYLVIQPIEFDYRHGNVYGYLALASFVLVLINFIMLKERSCQISLANGYQNYDLIQGFHIATLIVGIVVFILSYFNFALVIADYKILFYSSAAMIFACSGFMIYNAVTIVSAPCVSANYSAANQFIKLFDSSVLNPSAKNIFAAGDGIGITVFVFDILAACLMFLAGRRFYQKF
jgi:hypothetical protein